MSHTEWKAEDDGCETCLGHRGVYQEGMPVPDRPHDHCRCTIVTHNGAGGRYCHRDYNIVSALRQGGWDYSPATGVPEEITIEFDADIICKNGAEITVSFTLNYDGSRLAELQDASEQDYEGALGSVDADAEDKAREIAGTECPGCEPPPAANA